MGLEKVADVFRIFGGKKLEWNECRWELKLKIIKVKQMAKEGKRIDLLYAICEWSMYDAKSIQFVSYL